MYIEIIILVLSILLAYFIYRKADEFRERIIDVRKELEIFKGKYFRVIQIARNNKKLTRDRIKEIRKYDDEVKKNSNNDKRIVLDVEYLSQRDNKIDPLNSSFQTSMEMVKKYFRK